MTAMVQVLCNVVSFTGDLSCAQPRFRRGHGAVCAVSPHGRIPAGNWSRNGASFSLDFRGGKGRAQGSSRRLSGSGSPLPLWDGCPAHAQVWFTRCPATAARSPLSGLEAISEPSKEPQWGRMSMCFLNQKGGLSLAKAAQANKQKAVNGKMGAAGRSHDSKMRTIISLIPA